MINKRHRSLENEDSELPLSPVQGLSMWRGKQSKGSLQEKNPSNCDTGPELVDDPFMMFGFRFHLTTLVPAILDLEFLKASLLDSGGLDLFFVCAFYSHFLYHLFVS